MTDHDLKCWPEFFEPTLAGVKTFEIRRDDRGFAVGDRLHLREWVFCHVIHAEGAPCTSGYTGRECWATVTYILGLSEAAEIGCLAPGYVAMAIRLEEAQ